MTSRQTDANAAQSHETPDPAPGAESGQAPARADRRTWLAAAILLVGASLDLIDTTIVNVALPSIQRDLHVSYSGLQWVTAAYTLTFALVLITAGRLGDMRGRRLMFALGVAGFTLASLACGLAPNGGVLIGARVVQGVAAALMATQVLAIFQVIFPVNQRPAVLALYGSITGLAAVIGPVVGGLLIHADWFGSGWRSVFLVNVPIGIFTVIAVWLWVPETRAPKALQTDLPGVALVTLGLLAILYPLVQGSELGWPAWTFVSMAASVPLLAAFAWYQYRRELANRAPLVPMTLFRQRSFSFGLVVSLLFFIGIDGFFFVLTLYLQIGQAYSPLRTGLTVASFSIAVVIASMISAALAVKLGRWLICAGLVILAAGSGLLAYTVHNHGMQIHSAQLIPGLAVAGFGMGMVIVPIIDVILAGVRQSDAGAASGVLNTAAQLGAATGVAVIGVVFFNLLATQAAPSADSVTPAVRHELQVAGVPTGVQDQVITTFRQCSEQSAKERDPSKVPASCQQFADGTFTIPPNVANALVASGDEARRQDFLLAAERVFGLLAGIFLVTALLSVALPRQARELGATLA
jgi:EmrB/QacA subfamily drug resistance transporter